MALNEVRFEGSPDIIILKGVVHGDELLEDLVKNEPKRKTSKEHKVWRKNYNILVDCINKVCGFKRYSLKK